MELLQKLNRLIWKKMKEQNRETPEEKSRREVLFEVIEKIRNTPNKTSRTSKGQVKQHQQTKSIMTAKKPHPPFQMTPWTYRQSYSKSIWEPPESDTFKWNREAMSKKTWTNNFQQDWAMFPCLLLDKKIVNFVLHLLEKVLIASRYKSNLSEARYFRTYEGPKRIITIFHSNFRSNTFPF